MAWNRSTENKAEKSGRRHNGCPKAILAGVIVAVGAGIAAWLVFSRPAAPKAPEADAVDGKGLIRDEGGSVKPSAPAPAPARKAKKKGPYDDLPPIPEGHDLRTPTPGLRTDAERKADFERRRELRLRNRPKPVFDNPADQTVGMMLSADPTAAMPPVPTSQVSAEQYAELMKRDIPIDPDDPPEVVKIKKQVYAAREEVLGALADGATMADIASDVRERHNSAAALYQDANAQLNEILESGDEDLARSFVEKVNATFEQTGVPLLSLPSDRRREQLRQMIEARKKGKKK